MGWVRLDDGFFHNRKTLEVSNNALVLYMACLCHCSNQTTDGVISKAAFRAVARVRGVPTKAARELVGVGLWETHDEGYYVPDYLEYNPSAEIVKGRKEAHAAKMKQWRDAKRDASRSRSRDTPRGGLRDGASDGARDDDVTFFPVPVPLSISSLSDLRPVIPGVVESEIERKKAATLCERLAGMLPKAKPDDVVSCVWWALDGLDVNLVDELIGTCEHLNDKPRTVRYVATMIRNRASQAGVELDEWKGAA